MKNLYQYTKGISLIEILVSIVIVSAGLLALAAFEGNLMSMSGENKTRIEAQALAEDKVEELNNNIVKAGYDAALVNGTESITGTNAAYTRTWTVTDGVLTNQKLLTVVVSWGAAADEQVSIDNETIWTDPSLGLVAAAAADGAGTGALAPSPNNNSSTIGGEDRSSISDGTRLGDGTTDGSDPLTEFWVATDSSGQLTVHFNNQVEAALTCHGSVVLPFTGTVYSVNALTAIDIDISQVGQCFFDSTTAVTDANGFKSAKYACVACGNCEDTTPGTAGCPDPVSTSNNIGPGGWRGKIGLRGVGDTGGNQEQVCFNEQVLDPDAGASTGREYTTHRTVGAVVTSEGINTPYECHDFLVMDRSGGGPSSSCATGATTLASVTNLAPKKFTRNLADAAFNTVLAADDSFCTIPPNVVSISGQVTVTNRTQLNKLTLAMGSGGACTSLTATATTNVYDYSCTATTGATSVSVSLTTSQTNGANAVEVVAPSILTVTGIPGVLSFTGQDFVVQDVP